MRSSRRRPSARDARRPREPSPCFGLATSHGHACTHGIALPRAQAAEARLEGDRGAHAEREAALAAREKAREAASRLQAEEVACKAAAGRAAARVHCACCKSALPKADFSATQLLKRKQLRQCKQCAF